MDSRKYLILVRHSLTEIIENAHAREWSLSEQGRARAHGLAAHLIPYEPEIIVSSFERKAQQTATILGENLGLNFYVADGLHEHDRSRSPFYSADKFQSLVREFFDNPDALIFGSETANQAFLRFQKAVELTMSSNKNKTVLIVSHGTVISLFVSRLIGMDGWVFWQELGMPSYTVLDVQEKTMLITKNIK